jgi:hypothetical protein
VFYTFIQNNAFGIFKGPAIYVCVEASSSEEANQIAQKHGVYFTDTPECECCGYRWTPIRTGSKGTEKPEVFGESLSEQDRFYMIVYKDGRIEKGGTKETLW